MKLLIVLLGVISAVAAAPEPLPYSERAADDGEASGEEPLPRAEVEVPQALTFPEIPQTEDFSAPQEFQVPEPTPEEAEVKVARDDVEVVEDTDSGPVLKDSVLFTGVKPTFGAPPPVNPILAPRPAFAVQPVVPIRAPPVPIVRTVFRPVAPACPPMPPKPLDSDFCTWVAVKDHRHCVRQWECDPVPEPAIRCPRAPVRPDTGDRCNWIPILDKNNCIRKYECEPIPAEGCPPAPLPPDDHDSCKWISLKDAQGCIMDYECTPIKPIRPLRYGGYHW